MSGLPLRKSSIFLLLFLIIAGYGGNYFKLSFFHGIDFLFGSIASLIVARLYGVTWAVLCAFLASLHTILIWEHPYAVVIFTLETLFVGWWWRKTNNILLLDTIYWGIIGMPLVWLFYGAVMKITVVSVWIIALKQSVNGIFNALIASLLLTYLPLDKLSDRLGKARLISFEQTILNLLVATISFPALIFLTMDAQREISREELVIGSHMQTIARSTVSELQVWHGITLASLQELAALASWEGQQK